MTVTRKPALARASRSAERILAVLALGSIVVSVFAMLGKLYWVFELFSHFRVQILAAQLVLLILFAVRRRWVLTAMLVAVAAVNARVITPYWPQTNVALAAESSLAVMSANVRANTHDPARFLELVLRENPDVLLLLELNHAWASALAPLAERYPYSISLPRDGVSGIALLSRFPITEERVIDLVGMPAVDAQLVTPAGGALRFIGVHLDTPLSARHAADRNKQLVELARIARQTPQALIVAGDFNLTPYSPQFTALIEASGLRDSGARRGLSFSWPTFLPLLGIPIDHCLISEHFTVAQQTRGADFGSDHYPILTQLFIEGKAP
jgi:endonuclease/exonuclease/phosphatase (EEP) superfamily protein YafD